MRGPFDDDDDYGRRQSSNDAEVTLGAGTLLLLVVGLIVVCGVCFGIGYWVGHRGVASPAEAQQSVQQSGDAPQASTSPTKPSANTQPPPSAPSSSVPVPSAAAADNAVQPPASEAPQRTAAAPVPALSSAQNPAPGASQPQVRPALPTTTPSPQYPSRPADPTAQSQVRSAQAPGGVSLWVQVAAVSHVEDAQVLVNALKKKGYTVTPRREVDNLIHVRIGPFTSRDEANSWRGKLLNDGYNAEIQQ